MAKQDTESREVSAEVRNATEVLSPAERISRSLKDISREARRPTQVWLSFLKDSRGRPISNFGAGIVLGFLLIVVIPTLVSGLYLAFFTSDQYAAEVRFAVRGGEQRPSSDPISSLMGVSTVRVQDSQIVAQYIQGQGMVETLERTVKLRHLFAWPGKADFIFGFNPSRSVERLVKYWWWQVDVSIDRLSGIITVMVRAFTPTDALAIAQSIVSASETLVNELSERARNDALKQAQTELALAERVLQTKIQALRDLRRDEQILDPAKTSEALVKLLGELRLELAKMESDYQSLQRSVTEDAPQMRVLNSRIMAVREQIRQYEAKMTGAQSPNQQVLADSMSRFDQLRVEHEIAQKQYIEAATSLERARIEVESQQVYLTTFLQPVLAEEALYPKRWWIMLAILTICLLVWGAGTGIAVLVRNYSA